MTPSPLVVPRLLLAAAVASAAACHRTPETTPRRAELEGVLGDSAAFGARILRLDRAWQRATYGLAAPAYVLLLSVAPGWSIDPVWVDPDATPSMVPAGTHTAQLRPPNAVVPFGAPGRAPQVPLSSAAQAEIDRCIRTEVAAAERRAAAAERARRPARTVVRDSAGRPIEQPERDAAPAPMLEAGLERRIEAACTARYANRPGATPPDTHERYLVLLASSTPISAAELVVRLDGLTVTAGDARETIAAVAEGLYFDRQAPWAGYFVRW